LGHIFSEEHNVKQKGEIVRWNTEGQPSEVQFDNENCKVSHRRTSLLILLNDQFRGFLTGLLHIRTPKIVNCKTISANCCLKTYSWLQVEYIYSITITTVPFSPYCDRTLM